MRLSNSLFSSFAALCTALVFLAAAPLHAQQRLAAGAAFSVAVVADQVWTWGGNQRGTLGNTGFMPQSTPQSLYALHQVATVSAGWSHALAVGQDGSLWVWGLNDSGQLGLGFWPGYVFPILSPDMQIRRAPVQLEKMRNIVAVAAGAAHSLAVDGRGHVWVWGLNADGQLGLGNHDTKWTPTQNPFLQDIVAIAAGRAHSLALDSHGALWAWGGNESGQLGIDGMAESQLPIRVDLPVAMKVIAAGGDFSLGIGLEDGMAWSWGANNRGQLGQGDTAGSAYPRTIAGAQGVMCIAAGIAHGLAVLADGTLWGWGENGAGEVGVSEPAQISVPQKIVGLDHVVEVAAGAEHSIARTADGQLWAFGRNQFMQLGNGTGLDQWGSDLPVPVCPGLLPGERCSVVNKP